MSQPTDLLETGPAFTLGQREHTWKVLHETSRTITRDGAQILQVSQIRLLMRPADALDHDLAEHAAKEAVTAFNKNADFLAEYGLDDCGRADLFGEAASVLGTSGFLFAVELAMLLVTDVQGVLRADGKPLKPDRAGLAELLRNSYASTPGATFANKFLALACAPLWQVLEEGNASAAAPNGNGSAAVDQASAKNAE